MALFKMTNQPAHISLHQHNISAYTTTNLALTNMTIFSYLSTFISIFASYLKCLHAVPVVFPVLLYFTFLVYYHDMHLLVTGFPSFFLKKENCIF